MITLCLSCTATNSHLILVNNKKQRYRISNAKPVHGLQTLVCLHESSGTNGIVFARCVYVKRLVSTK